MNAAATAADQTRPLTLAERRAHHRDAMAADEPTPHEPDWPTPRECDQAADRMYRGAL